MGCKIAQLAKNREKSAIKPKIKTTIKKGEDKNRVNKCHKEVEKKNFVLKIIFLERVSTTHINRSVLMR